MPTPRITFRVSESLLAAMTKRASSNGQTITEYLTALAAADCGLKVEARPQGFAALTPEKRSEIALLGGKKRRKRKKSAGRKAP